MDLTCQGARGLLVSRLRGTLSRAEDAFLDAHLRTCAGCTAALEAERALDDVLDAQLPRFPAPRALTRKLARGWPAREPARRRLTVPLAIAAAAAVLVAFSLDRVRSADDALASEATRDHLLRLDGAPLAQITGGLHEVKPWFNGKLDFAPAVHFAGDADYPLQGGAVATFLEHPAALFVYTRRAHRISLFVVDGPAPAFPAWPRARTVKGFNVLLWQREAQGFALVSDLNLPELRELGARLRAGP